MLLARLRRMLNLDKVVQKSFAEYHSKRDFVERVHATENEALSKHGPFCSHQIHKTVRIGSKEHKENMTAMAEDIEKCLSSGVFYHDKPLEAFKGLSNTEFVFDDESQLRQFFSLSDSRKAEWKETAYQPKQTKMLD